MADTANQPPKATIRQSALASGVVATSLKSHARLKLAVAHISTKASKTLVSDLFTNLDTHCKNAHTIGTEQIDTPVIIMKLIIPPLVFVWSTFKSDKLRLYHICWYLSTDH